MEVAVAVVTSIDSKMTRGDESDIHSWVSDEDQEVFQALRDSHDVLVMGSHTYEQVRNNMKHSPNRLRVVLTSRPKQYAEYQIAGQLEFHNKTVIELVDYLKPKDYKKLLIVGGGQMITDFLQNSLVDKIYLTLEPRLFGEGQPMITQAMDQKLRLLSCEKANDTGTLLLVYSVK